MIDRSMVAVDWSGLAHKCWNRVHKDTYETRTNDMWTDFVGELALECAKLRWLFGGTIVFLADGERPYGREQKWNEWYRQHSRIYSTPEQDTFLLILGTGPEAIKLEWLGGEWKKSKTTEADLRSDMVLVEDEDILAMGLAEHAPKYKERNWAWPEPKEDFQRIHLGAMDKISSCLPDSSWVRLAGFEADELASALCAEFREKTGVILVTEDSDWRQLRTDGMVNGCGFDMDVWNRSPAECIESFWAKVLGGDSSDGIPGLRKSATQRFGKEGALGWIAKNPIVDATQIPAYGTPEFERNFGTICLSTGPQPEILDDLAANYSAVSSILIPWDLFKVPEAKRIAAENASRLLGMDARMGPLVDIPF